MAVNMLFYGNEPYRLMEKREALKRVGNPEMNLCIIGIFDQETYELAFQMPFLEEKRVIILEMEDCKAPELLTSYLKAPAASTNLYIFVNRMDRRSMLAKAFPAERIFELNKYTEKELDEKIRKSVKEHHKVITDEAREAFKERIRYDQEEVCFFDVQNELKKLCVLTDYAIDKRLVERAVSRHEKENVFALIQMIVEQKAEKLFHEAELIIDSKDSNAIQVLSLLLRSYRISMKAALLGSSGEKDIGVHPKAVIRMPKEACMVSMDCIQEVIDGIKAGKYQEQEGLILCLSKLMEYGKEAGKSC